MQKIALKDLLLCVNLYDIKALAERFEINDITITSSKNKIVQRILDYTSVPHTILDNINKDGLIDICNELEIKTTKLKKREIINILKPEIEKVLDFKSVKSEDITRNLNLIKVDNVFSRIVDSIDEYIKTRTNLGENFSLDMYKELFEQLNQLSNNPTQINSGFYAEQPISEKESVQVVFRTIKHDPYSFTTVNSNDEKNSVVSQEDFLYERFLYRFMLINKPLFALVSKNHNINGWILRFLAFFKNCLDSSWNEVQYKYFGLALASIWNEYTNAVYFDEEYYEFDVMIKELGIVHVEKEKKDLYQNLVESIYEILNKNFENYADILDFFYDDPKKIEKMFEDKKRIEIKLDELLHDNDPDKIRLADKIRLQFRSEYKIDEYDNYIRKIDSSKCTKWLKLHFIDGYKEKENKLKTKK